MMNKLLCCSFILALVACSDSSVLSSQDRLIQVRAQPPVDIESIPKFSEQPIYVYSSRFKRSPFILESDFVANITAEESQTQSPNLSREKQSLELYEVSFLSMVGVLRNKDKIWGLVADPSGKVTKVELGSYLGKNFGEVASVDSDKITIIEKISDNKGRWFARPRLILMKEAK
jgi:type IV pilus assembly protein PilP